MATKKNTTKPTKKTGQFDDSTVRTLAELLDETGLTDIEVESEGWRIKVSRHHQGQVHVAAPAPAPIAAPAASAAVAPADNETPATNDFSSHPGAVKSPMVGTAYMQSEPGAPAFVQVGDSVQAGQTLMIIEAMKVMNPIKAEKAGKISQILIENGQPVEFDEVMMVIE